VEYNNVIARTTQKKQGQGKTRITVFFLALALDVEPEAARL